MYRIHVLFFQCLSCILLFWRHIFANMWPMKYTLHWLTFKASCPRWINTVRGKITANNLLWNLFNMWNISTNAPNNTLDNIYWSYWSCAITDNKYNNCFIHSSAITVLHVYTFDLHLLFLLQLCIYIYV